MGVPTETFPDDPAGIDQIFTGDRVPEGPFDPPMQCRECCCTDECACPGGCYWVEPGLCSTCADHQVARTVTAVMRRKIQARRVA